MASIPDALQTYRAITRALSPDRMAVFETAAAKAGQYHEGAAIALYSWNAQVCGALLAPLHVVEIVIRNAAAEALQKVYGTAWPRSHGFVTSLPHSAIGYSPKSNLQAANQKFTEPNEIINALNFAFWQRLFTNRHDKRLWDKHLRIVLPHLDPCIPVPILRQKIYSDLDRLRRLRNRIAHHEPIFQNNLEDDFDTIKMLISCRCRKTSAWMLANQTALATIAARPG